MAHAFKPIPAKPTFGTLTQVVYQGDYITNKKAKLAFCKGNKKLSCNKNNKVSSYDQSNLFNKGRYLDALERGCILPFDKTNLITGLYSKMNLEGACTVINGNPCSSINSCGACLTGAQIDASSLNAFYLTNTIDPLGQLFGNSACGTNNFTRFMVYKKY
jgi:hypothetical protein